MVRKDKELKLKGRHRLKAKEARQILDHLRKSFGIDLEEVDLDVAKVADLEVVLSARDLLLFRRPDTPWVPTIPLLLKHPEAGRKVVIDMGGVKAVSGGANVMAPGVVDCDPAVMAGDVVWVAEERYGKPLAVGIAQMDAKEMVEGKRGVAVKSLHHVGDVIWEVGGGAG